MRVAILVSAPFDEGLRDQVRQDREPQRDFLALAEALDAKIIRAEEGPTVGRSLPLALWDTFKSAWKVFRQRSQYDLIITDVERIGIPFAILLKLFRSKKKHVMICHSRVVRPGDIRLIRALRLYTHIHRFVCYGPAVASKVVKEIGVSPEQVVTVLHPADHHFWRPMPVTPERLVSSAGYSKRDYPTLIEAVRGLDVSVEIAAFSPWTAVEGLDELSANLPPNVRLVRYTPFELRQLYARSLFVAVPLQNRVTQVGSLVIYEAMAMGKAVVVTRTEGQAGLELVKENETGLYVPPGDVQAWREAIEYLLSHPEDAMRMGQNARRVVEERLNMDNYVREMVAIVRSLEPAQQRRTHKAHSQLSA